MRITKIYAIIMENRLHKSAGYDFSSCFRSAAKCNLILHKSAKMGLAGQSLISRSLLNLEPPNLAQTPTPTDSTAIPDMTSPAPSGLNLWKCEKKTVENAASNGFESNCWRTV